MKSKQAFTLIEILMVLTLVGILSAVSVSALDGISNDASFDKTFERMNIIKKALIGDLDTNKQGVRVFFGYLGDIGRIPTTLQGIDALIHQPAGVAAWGFNTTSRTGMGWRGPYLKRESGVNWLIDGWGHDFVYNGDASTPYLLSYGADGVAGGSGTAADIQIDFPASQRISDVSGVINRNSMVFDGQATVELYTANGTGGLQILSPVDDIVSGSNGAFTITNVPMGLRSLKVTIPLLSDPIGPVFIPVDKPKYQIPHNYLDSSPGEMPHVCADIDNYTYFAGSIARSYTSPNGRIYFEIDVTQSMTINSLFVMSSGGNKFRAIRIGNVEKDCNDEIECYDNHGSRTTPDLTNNNSQYFPEMNLKTGVGALPWTIPVGRLGGYVEFDGDTTNQTLQLRLGCRLVKMQ